MNDLLFNSAVITRIYLNISITNHDNQLITYVVLQVYCECTVL